MGKNRRKTAIKRKNDGTTNFDKIDFACLFDSIIIAIAMTYKNKSIYKVYTDNTNN